MRELFVKLVEVVIDFVTPHLYWWWIGQPVVLLVAFIVVRINYYSLLKQKSDEDLKRLWWFMKILKYLTIAAFVFSFILFVLGLCLLSMPEFRSDWG